MESDGRFSKPKYNDNGSLESKYQNKKDMIFFVN